MSSRTRLYTLLQVGRTQLGWDEDTYRAFLKDHNAQERKGRVSATTMRIGDLTQALADMQACGFKPTRKRGKKADGKRDWRAPRIAKITALWCALADAGVIENRGEASMLKWCAGVTRVSRLEWCTSTQLNNCVEGLKRWANREKVRLAS